jgi:hypothetical protein
MIKRKNDHKKAVVIPKKVYHSLVKINHQIKIDYKKSKAICYASIIRTCEAYCK